MGPADEAGGEVHGSIPAEAVEVLGHLVRGCGRDPRAGLQPVLALDHDRLAVLQALRDQRDAAVRCLTLPAGPQRCRRPPTT